MTKRQRAPGRLPTWKKLLYALLALSGFFLLLEGVLALFGVQPVLHDEDPYVGLVNQVPLFTTETRENETFLVTAKNKEKFFNQQAFPLRKAAGTYRIFCVGGSTTYGRPYGDRTSFCGWLRAFLPRAMPSRKWEVINAGGISYASYRVALLMEELADYEPDLFVVYSGHNEFLEERTYRELVTTPTAVRAAEALLGRTRLYSAVRSILRPTETVDPTDASGLLPAEVETRLDSTVGPEDYTRDDDLRVQTLAHYRFNLGRIVEIARSAGAAVLFVTPASNLRDCSPFKSEFSSSAATAEQNEIHGLLEESRRRLGSDPAAALTLLDRAQALDDRYAETHYRRAQALDALGRGTEARASYRRALEEDVCPLRALADTREIVLDVTRERDVPVVDFADWAAQNALDGIPGKDLFLDHVHPTIEGNRRLALLLVERLASASLLETVEDWNAQTIEGISAEVVKSLDPRVHGTALRNLAKVLGWAGKFEDVRRLASQAIRKIPDDSEAYFLLGVAHEELGELEAARAAYERTLALEATYVDAHHNLGRTYERLGALDHARRHYEAVLRMRPDEAKSVAALGNLLVNQGELADGIAHLQRAVKIDPLHAEAQQKLGVVFLRQGRLPDAEKHLREAVRLRPGFARAQNNLGVVFAQTERPQEAEACFREALRLDPAYSKALEGLGDLAMRRHQLPAAVGYFTQAYVRSPGKGRVQEKLSFLGRRLESRLASDPENAQVLYLTALIQGVLGAERPTVTVRFRTALQLARAQGNEALAREIAAHLRRFAETSPKTPLPNTR